MPLSLVILAAGMGSRYGGLKQFDPIGPGGETVLDYSVFDAMRAGFSRVVFVIRREAEAQFRELVGRRYANRIVVDYVFQSLDALPPGVAVPPGREKPWGTGHALWCGCAAVRDNFAVINADDFYGPDSFVQLAGFLAEARGGESAMIGFRLANTLSEHGGVSRGVCTVGPAGELRSIVEVSGIRPADIGPGAKYSGQELVSMNCWGFTPAFRVGLEKRLAEFLTDLVSGGGATDQLASEFYLPAAVSASIARNEITVRVIPTRGAWFGVTFREDRPRVQAALNELVRAGHYPAALWS
jgi:MobA-like NTP transferase domain